VFAAAVFEVAEGVAHHLLDRRVVLLPAVRPDLGEDLRGGLGAVVDRGGAGGPGELRPVAHHRHLEAEEPPGGGLDGLLLQRPELLAEGERGLGEPVGDDRGAGGPHRPLPPRRVGLGPPADGLDFLAELARDGRPRRPAGAQFRDFLQRVVGGFGG
jgi:hypothetical protein